MRRKVLLLSNVKQGFEEHRKLRKTQHELPLCGNLVSVSLHTPDEILGPTHYVDLHQHVFVCKV